MTVSATTPSSGYRKLVLAISAIGAIVSLPAVALVSSSSAMAQIPTDNEAARLRAEQEAPQQLVPFDPTHFDKYVGYYQLGPNVIFKITRDGGKLLTQLTGQGPVQVYPESETKFFATVVAAQISFVTNPQGEVTELILHQNGQEQHAKKIDEAAAKNIEAALADRIKNNMPSPGTEAFLRRYIASQEAGKPDYSEMTPGLELAARTQQDRLTSDIAKWGPLLSVEFTRVNPGGNDVYMLTFKNEKVPTIVAPVGADGKVGGLLFQPQ
jgi:hypothetical protein